MLKEEFKQFIKENAKKVYPNECCGLIFEDNIVSCKNISSEPLTSFIIDYDELNKYNLNEIIGFYHSHKDFSEFSQMDIAFSEKLKKKSILYICDLDKFLEYSPLGIKIPYVGRPFFLGQFDCLTLCQDYYERELNIKINKINKFVSKEQLENYKKWNTDEFKEYENNSLLFDFFKSQGFIEVGFPKKHDIILTKIPGIKFTSHICIYLGENKILHHFLDFSGIIAYNNALRRLTTHILRHNSLI